MIETALTEFSRARVALQRARSIDEVKAIKDWAERMRLYLWQQAESLEMQNDAAEIGLRAERRMGEMLREGERAAAGDNQHVRRGSDTASLPPTHAEIGISRKQSSRYQAVAAIPQPVFEEEIRERKESRRELTKRDMLKLARELQREERREVDRERIKRVPALRLKPGERVPTLMLDPGWDYRDVGMSERSVGVRPPYAQMRLPQIAALPVGDLTLPDSHVYLWVPNAFLLAGHGASLLEGWGFRPVHIITWVKPNSVAGAYLMCKTEFLLFGVRGSLGTKTQSLPDVITGAPQGPHSTKPEEAYRLIEEASPGPWLELFARRPRRGWVTWGDVREEGAA